MTMKITAVRTIITVPAGTYWVGDPCYSVPEELWMPLLKDSDFFRQPIGTVYGTEVLAFSTKWGDGVYYDQDRRDYGVDAGLIGLVPAGVFPDPSPGLVHKITFDHPFECVNDNGILHFGHITIDTVHDENPIEDDYFWEDLDSEEEGYPDDEDEDTDDDS